MESDASHVLKCQAGDQEAFGVLYDAYVEKIYRFIYYKIFTREIAEDLTSEVFTKALQKIHTYDSAKGPFSAWLYRIARNAVIDYYRTRKATLPIDDMFDVADDDRTVEQNDATRALEKVSAYLKTLNAKQREIITLRIWEERSYREIAEIVGGTEDSVKMAFSRSIRDVREKCGTIGLVLLCILSNSNSLPFKDFS